MILNVVDAGCGIGKTTAAINMINDDDTNQKYLFITPFLSEVERIKKSCPTKEFCSPEDFKETKLKHLARLIDEGKNIVTTHALFKRVDETMISLTKLNEYVLIMDEVAELVEELPISKADLKILSNEYISVHPRTHMTEWNDDSYSGKFDDYMRMIKNNNVFAYVDNKTNIIVSLMWMFPYKIFESLKKIYVLTYMFDGQIQKRYFDYFRATYIKLYVKNFRLTTEVQRYDYSETKKMIHVCDVDKLNEIGDKKTALSVSWFRRNKKTYKMTELQNNIRNFFRSYTKADHTEMLWTTFKEYTKYVKKKGFVKGFAPINSRATNEYGNKTAIAYIGNRFFKPTIKNFFTFNNIPVNNEFEDKFALSEMVQFIFRSAIRNHQPIDVYIPSKRMRELFIAWLKKPNV